MQNSHLEIYFCLLSSKVNWEDYNYPPLLKIIHFRLNDVEESGARKAVFWAHVNLIAVCVALVLNVVGTAVLAGMGVRRKGVPVLYSIFNLILVSALGLYSFYHCYKGTATQNRRLCKRFYLSHSLMMVFMLLAAVLDVSSFNGWMGLWRAQASQEPLRNLWTWWTVLEASLWTANLVTGAAVIMQMKGHDGHEHIGPVCSPQELGEVRS